MKGKKVHISGWIELSKLSSWMSGEKRWNNLVNLTNGVTNFKT